MIARRAVHRTVVVLERSRPGWVEVAVVLVAGMLVGLLLAVTVALVAGAIP